MQEWIEIFRAGKYPQGALTVEDLKEVVANYDTTYFEAPITLNHSEEGPAYGKVEALKVDEKGRLFAKFKNVSEELIDMIKKGKYTERSAEFYTDLDGRGKYLRAVSFVLFPAVKGMEPIKLSEIKFPSGSYIKFEDYKTTFIVNIFQKLRDFFIEQFGLETAENTIPSYTLDTLKDLAKEDEEQNNNLEYREDKVSEQEFLRFKEEKEREILKLREELEHLKMEKRSKECLEFFERLNLLPKHKNKFITFMQTLSDDKIRLEEKETTQIELFKELLDDILNEKNSIKTEFKYSHNRAKDDNDLCLDTDAMLFTEVEKYAKEKNISFTEALNIILGR